MRGFLSRAAAAVPWLTAAAQGQQAAAARLCVARATPLGAAAPHTASARPREGEMLPFARRINVAQEHLLMLHGDAVPRDATLDLVGVGAQLPHGRTLREWQTPG